MEVYTNSQQRGLGDSGWEDEESNQFTSTVGRKTGNWAVEIGRSCKLAGAETSSA
jgi:hypothetical protein